MGKQGKQRKRKRLEQDLSNITNDDEVSLESLSTTLNTLSTLANSPHLLSDKRYKALRVIIHRFQNDTLIPAGKSLSGKVSDALRDKQYDIAIDLLASMRQRSEVPRLGALQRWVRDCDAVGFADRMIIRTLDAILRTADPSQVCTTERGVCTLSGVVYENTVWSCGPKKSFPYSVYPRESVLSKFDLVGVELGPDRLPPNEFDCKIYASRPGTIILSNDSPVTCVTVPFLNESMCLVNVLSVEECNKILAYAMAIGLQPDRPMSSQLSTLADNMIWCADETLMTSIYQRCLPFLPAAIDGRKIAGINRRWRLYRYTPGAEYRPHIDGGWPGSGVVDGAYVYDEKGDSWSRLTFLLYLNDDFEDGHTTYFTPSKSEGCLEAFKVVPSAGCVMVFPHGDSRNATLHEGSGVSKGAKFIIRTDVLYYKE